VAAPPKEAHTTAPEEEILEDKQAVFILSLQQKKSSDAVARRLCRSEDKTSGSAIPAFAHSTALTPSNKLMQSAVVV